MSRSPRAFTVLGASVGLQRAVGAGLNKTRHRQTRPPITAHAREDAGEVAGTIPDCDSRV
jgi:hypothetical protein